MDIFVRYWNDDRKNLETRYLKSQFLGSARAYCMREKFENGVGKKINKANNLLQIASDGPNVNWLFLKRYEEKRCFNELPALLDIGTCDLHTIHGSLKKCGKSKWLGHSENSKFHVQNSK